VTSGGSAASEQKEARALQGFLMRAEQQRQRRAELSFLAAVRESLSQRTQPRYAAVVPESKGQFTLPSICSFASEQAETAELFWCYGFHGTRRDLPGAGCLLLIALCQQEPSAAQVEGWQRKLESERAASAPSRELSGGPQAGMQGLSELWVVVPPGSSLNPVASELRLYWDDFVQLLAEDKEMGEVAQT
jgi:hypothetical protein